MEESKGGVRLNQQFHWGMHQKAKLIPFLQLIDMKMTKFLKTIKDNLLFYLIQPTKINKNKITLNQLKNIAFVLVRYSQFIYSILRLVNNR